MADEPPKFKNTDAEAAYHMADLFCQSVLHKIQKGYRDLYCWEQGALDWLRAWRLRDQESPLNAWTSSYMRHGPPPWRPDQD